jgi:GNAT superfamily N-acetyltransferase
MRTHPDHVRFRMLDRQHMPDGPPRRRLSERLVELDTQAAAGLGPGEEPGDVHKQSLSASASYWARHGDFLDQADGLVLALSGPEIVGFSSFSVWLASDPPIQFLSYAAVRRDYQRSGILTRLVRLAAFHMVRARHHRWFSAARTVNPAVLDAWLSGRAPGHPQVYPDVPAMPFEAPPDAIDAAREVCRRTYPGSGFDPATFVASRDNADLHLLACATGILRIEPPRTTADVTRFFESHVNAVRGDAVIVVRIVDRQSGHA